MQPLLHWSYLRLRGPYGNLYTCVLSDDAVTPADLVVLGQRLNQEAVLVAHTRLVGEAMAALDTACRHLHATALMDELDALFGFGLYSEDVLGLDNARFHFVQASLAKAIADSTLRLAATSSRLFPRRVDVR